MYLTDEALATIDKLQGVVTVKLKEEQIISILSDYIKENLQLDGNLKNYYLTLGEFTYTIGYDDEHWWDYTELREHCR